jgi:hypothetical protein
MGWASGSEIFNVILRTTVKHIPNPETRKEFYLPIYDAFCDKDCDTLGECHGIDKAFDDLLYELSEDRH